MRKRIALLIGVIFMLVIIVTPTSIKALSIEQVPANKVWNLTLSNAKTQSIKVTANNKNISAIIKVSGKKVSIFPPKNGWASGLVYNIVLVTKTTVKGKATTTSKIVKSFQLEEVTFEDDNTGNTANQGTSSGNPPKAVEKKIYGKIKGSITWQYNKIIGTKADVGAKIYLISKDYDSSQIKDSDAGGYSMSGFVPKYLADKLFYATVNGYGSYEINNVPKGTYIMVISSKNTTRDITEPIDDYIVNLLKPYFKDWDNFVLFNLKMNKFTFKIVEIKDDSTIDVSHDFGYTYI